MRPILFTRRPTPPPRSYVEFIASNRQYAERRGLKWEIKVDEFGKPLKEQDWDLRKLADCKEDNAAKLNGFAIDSSIQDIARESGIPCEATNGVNVLHDNVQEFIKAAAVALCRAGYPPRKVRNLVNGFRSIFSVLSSAPWELTTERVDLFNSLDVDNGLRRALRLLCSLFNDNLLSRNCPIECEYKSNVGAEILAHLAARSSAGRLPDRDVIYELTRIVFQETAMSHADVLRFAVTQIQLFTGLRIEEVRWLPLDCLRWSEHMDISTGRPAGEVGGITRILRIRYYAEKLLIGQPGLLVEKTQVVPDRFVDHIAAAVKKVQECTESLRHLLLSQRKSPTLYPHSDQRVFSTSTGLKVNCADFLFLTIRGLRSPLPKRLASDAPVCRISRQACADFLHSSRGTSVFLRYRRATSPLVDGVRSHALRHLLDTELVSHDVPDTMVTKHFGRKSVASSKAYDHRSLAEKLAFVELPEEAYTVFSRGSPVETVAKMAVAGAIGNSKIAQSFLMIQRQNGDAAAFSYLAANADGFHVTPYGFCVNSFAMNPCEKHLKCFDNCRHFAPSGLEVHTIKLSVLRERLTEMRARAASRPANSVGRQNQILHADQLLKGVEAAMSGNANVQLFPNGHDYSNQRKDNLS